MGWLSGWAKRVKLTIDQADIDADLANFPIFLYLSTSSGYNAKDISFIFDELTADANRKKIAVTTSDGTTECKVEIEKWDDANEKALLWVKAPSITDVGNTDLYLYYDSTHADNDANVGDPESAPAMAVWDANFRMVHHMRDYNTSNIHDSTTNNVDGAKRAAGEPAVTTSGKIDDAQSFDGTNDHILSGIVDLKWRPSLEIWIKTSTDGRYVLDYNSGTGTYGWECMIISHKLEFHYLAADGTAIVALASLATVDDGNWHHICITDDATTLRLYIDGALDNSVATATPVWTTNMYVLWATYKITDNNYEFLGIQDEIRNSDTVRTASWIKATYEAGRDHLLDWGSEETSGPITGWRKLKYSA